MNKILIEKYFKALGTEIEVWIVSQEKEKNKLEKKFNELKYFYFEKEEKLSRFFSSSELVSFNNNLGKFQKASEEILHLSKKSLEYFDFSGGFFDPRVIENLEKIGYKKDFYSPDFDKEKITPIFSETHSHLKNDLEIKRDEVVFRRKMDFSGIAKGYITDKAADILRNEGCDDFLITSGGDIFASGKNEQGLDWEIVLEGFPESKFSLKVSNKGVATSGISRRKWENEGKKFHHLVNPKNPENFSFVLKSVTVIEDSTEKSDVFAKILFLMGKKEGLEFAEKNKIAGIFLDYRGNIFVSKEAKKYALF